MFRSKVNLIQQAINHKPKKNPLKREDFFKKERIINKAR